MSENWNPHECSKKNVMQHFFISMWKSMRRLLPIYKRYNLDNLWALKECWFKIFNSIYIQKLVSFISTLVTVIRLRHRIRNGNSVKQMEWEINAIVQGQPLKLSQCWKLYYFKFSRVFTPQHVFNSINLLLLFKLGSYQKNNSF